MDEMSAFIDDFSGEIKLFWADGRRKDDNYGQQDERVGVRGNQQMKVIFGCTLELSILE